MSNESLAQYYMKYTTTQMMENDIKSIKKINNIILKFNKTQKLSYIFEVINIIKSLNNYINIIEAEKDILEYVDDAHHKLISIIISNVEHIDIELLRKKNVIPS